MPNEITEKDSVKIAEWLGWERDKKVPHINRWTRKVGNSISISSGVVSWLSSPEGEVAIMDKVCSLMGNIQPKENMILDISFFLNPEGTMECCLEMLYGERIICDNAPTRNEALQLAILEMLKEAK